MDSATSFLPDRGSFTIVSYNIRHGEDMTGLLELRAPGWVAMRENPRFVGLQEVDMKTTRVKGADTCAILAETTGLHATFAKAIDYAGGEYGNALLSREVPATVRRIPLPGAEPRVLLLCEFDDCWVGVTHLAVDSDEARIQSIAIIRDAVASCCGKPVFLMGDWNATPDSAVLDGMRGFLTILSDENTCTCHGQTFDPAWLHDPSHCIDYIAIDTAHRGDYLLRGRRVIEQRRVSDHAPTVVDVVPAAGASKPEYAFTAATINVRCPGDGGDLVWYRRMPRVAKIVRDHGFDLFGVQEAVVHQAAILDTELPAFARVGCGRDADRNGEAMYIYYRKNRFECLEDGTFWLSATPDEPGSRIPGAGCPRNCTWALFADRVTGRRFRFFNTHLDCASEAVRREELRILFDHALLPAKARGETIFLTGDFNETLDKADTPETVATLFGEALAERAKVNAIALAYTELTDTYAASETPHDGPFRTGHGYHDEPSSRIDYVFATPDVRVLAHATITDKPEGQFATDHYPVAATIEFPVC